jgi:hypothetical protein
MSLNLREQQDLDLIRDSLAGSDSGLAALLGTFNRLASGERMPGHEKIWPGSKAAAGCAGPGRRRSHRRCRYPGQRHQRLSRWAPPLFMVLLSLSLITVALVFSRMGSPGTCPPSLAMVCAHPDSVRSLYPALGTGS